MNEEIYNYLINHIVFPIDLPKESIDDENDIYFLKIVNEVISDLNRQFIFLRNSPQFIGIKNLLCNWNKLQGNSNKLSEHEYFYLINSLYNDQSLTVFLRAQNTCLTIKKITNSDHVLTMFQASLENEKVMSTEKDIEIIFPSQSILSDKSEVIKSFEFSKLIADLANSTFEESAAVSYKAHQQHVEVRDVPNTKLISEWLFAYLVSNRNGDENIFPSKITKKYRDNVIVSKLLPFRRSG